MSSVYEEMKMYVKKEKEEVSAFFDGRICIYLNEIVEKTVYRTGGSLS